MAEIIGGVAKVSCILRHRVVQLILAYSLARPAIPVAGKGRGGMFYYAPAIFSGVGHIVSSLSVRTPVPSVRSSRTSVPYVTQMV